MEPMIDTLPAIIIVLSGWYVIRYGTMDAISKQMEEDGWEIRINGVK